MIAVIMAGGEGQRLRPLTDATPKPMLPVGGRPILETQVRQLVRAGVERIWLNVRHLAEQIGSHFGDGADFGCEIRYLYEPEPYGTAGGLSLIPLAERPTTPFLVLNADILCPFDFAAFRAFHIAHGNMLTLVGRTHTYTVPYGYPVMGTTTLFADTRGKVEHMRQPVVDFREKPTFTYRVNSGIYCLDPAVLDGVPSGPYDMPDLIRWACARYTVGLYPLDAPYHEIGRLESYREAEAFYREHMR